MNQTTADFVKTKKKVITKRGVMWLGQTCNLRCYFCYFINRIEDNTHPEHAFMSFDKAKKICCTLRNFYDNRSIDIQGGEPTIFNEILDLIRYCREIGLAPTLITNGLVLGKPGRMEEYRDAGVRDFLVSLHGVGDLHDEAVRVKGAYQKIAAAIERMRELEIPFRFNCTMSKPVVPVITQVAQKAVEFGAKAVNFIAFNPFSDQLSGHRRADTVERYTEIKPRLKEAIDKLEEAGIETNVRYLPMCMADPRHRKNFYNFQQLSYDVHEWDFQSWFWTMMPTQMMKEGNLMPPFRLGPYAARIYKGNAEHTRDNYERHPLKQGTKFAAQRTLARLVQTVKGRDTVYREEARRRASTDCCYRHGEACQRCALRNICDGFHGDYAEFFGTEEAAAVTDIPLTDDPLFYIREQEKLVCAEDTGWAL
ncbi:MAG TPA: radical SAM protein [Candidatus Hydrogenedentes bacterium]|nr:radical SAM protein [Candidatus Hydrogenedentota bacterium]